MRIELTRSVLMPWLASFLRNSTIHFRMCLYNFGNTFPEIYDFVAVPVTRSKNFVSRLRLSNETVTFRKYVTKYINMRKSMVEFLRKFESHGIRIAWVSSILITRSINFLHFYTVLGSAVIKGDFSCIVHLLTSLCLHILGDFKTHLHVSRIHTIFFKCTHSGWVENRSSR